MFKVIMKYGYDLYEVNCLNIVSLLMDFKQDKLDVFALTKVAKDTYRFYLPIYQRFKVKKYSFKLVKSVGLLSYLYVLIIKKINLVGVISFALTLVVCNQFIFKIEIKGNNLTTNQMVTAVLKDNHISAGDLKKSYHQLNDLYDDLKAGFNGRVDYLNVYQDGGVLFVEYTNSKSSQEVEANFQNIIASKDGVIQRIEVSSGNIVVKVNQFVRKGDLLVSNTITSTSDQSKIIATKGKIMAYTYQVYEAKIDAKIMDEGAAFSYLLASIRRQINAIDKIDREKVVYYDIMEGNRVLKIQYVLIEDIATKEEY